jgi:hypothetical protein
MGSWFAQHEARPWSPHPITALATYAAGNSATRGRSGRASAESGRASARRRSVLAVGSGGAGGDAEPATCLVRLWRTFGLALSAQKGTSRRATTPGEDACARRALPDETALPRAWGPG